MSADPTYWCVVPAAGVGKRMGVGHPKQYLSLLNKTVCEHTLLRLLSVPAIRKIVVCLSPDDTWWPTLPLQDEPRIVTVTGGRERCYSVLNGLHFLQTLAADDDWVLVHDVARPCVRREDIEHLIAATRHHKDGGILATPVRDTLKRSGGDQHITETVDRTDLWHALTPQIFRTGALTHALQSALAENVAITDEASAIEWAGGEPVLVEGHPDNIKITHPGDLSMALLYLQQHHSRPTQES